MLKQHNFVERRPNRTRIFIDKVTVFTSVTLRSSLCFLDPLHPLLSDKDSYPSHFPAVASPCDGQGNQHTSPRRTEE